MQHQKTNFYLPFLQEQHRFGGGQSATPAPVSAPAPAPAPPPAPPPTPTPAQKAQAQAPLNQATALQQTILAPPNVNTNLDVTKKTLLGQ